MIYVSRTGGLFRAPMDLLFRMATTPLACTLAAVVLSRIVWARERGKPGARIWRRKFMISTLGVLDSPLLFSLQSGSSAGDGFAAAAAAAYILRRLFRSRAQQK